MAPLLGVSPVDPKLKLERPRLSERTITLAIVLVSFIALAAVASGEPSAPGDTLKFQFVGRFGSIVHPPGSPLYLLLLWAASFLPYATSAGAANILSSLGAALSLGFVYQTFRLLTVPLGARFIALALLLTCGHFHRQATTAEVYAWHLALQSAAIYFAVSWAETKTLAALTRFCLAYALGFGVHLATLTMLPAVAYWLIRNSDATARYRFIIPALGSSALGVAVYGYLPWRSFCDPLYQEANLRDFEALLWYVSGGYYRDRFFGVAPLAILSEKLPKLLLWFASSGPLSLVVLGAWAIKLQLSERPRFARFLALLFAGRVLYVLTYRIPDIDEYYPPLALYLALALGSGLPALSSRLRNRRVFYSVIIATGLSATFSLAYSRRELADLESRQSVSDLRKALASIDGSALLLSSNYEQSMAFGYLVFGEESGIGKHFPIHVWNRQILAKYLRAERVPFMDYVEHDPTLNVDMLRKMRERDRNALWLLPFGPTLRLPRIEFLLVEKGRAEELKDLPVETSRTLRVGAREFQLFRVQRATIRP